MNIYLWQAIDRATTSYHPEGGLVVIAETEEEARKYANSTEGVMLRPDEQVDYTCPCDGEAGRVFVFQDTGCC